MKRAQIVEALVILVASLIFALVVGIWPFAAHGQTAPAGFCGFASVALPTQVTNSAAVHASQSVSNTTASAAPTIPIPYGSTTVGALVYVEQTGIRFRTDGATVSGTFDGNPLAAGSTVSVCGSDLTRWSAIASSTGSNAILRWNFYTTGR